MIKVNCTYCHKVFEIYPCRFRKSKIFFCNKSCHRTYKNLQDNPSHYRDLSGPNNPMYGKHTKAWNKGYIGEKSHNWKGGIHKRKDGYVRININGNRYLLHRYLVRDKITDDFQVVHHIDGNPSNNDLSNLVVLKNQTEHARLHKLSSRTK